MVHLREGHQSWSEISAIHSEQNILVPSLFALLLSAIRRGWVITRETSLSVSVLFATLGVWWRVIIQIVPTDRRYWTLALISLLASSLTQAENWMWGFQMSFFISNLCVAVVVLTFVVSDRGWSLPLGIVALVVASYSIGFGLTCTLGGVVFYGITRRKGAFAVWTSVSIVLIVLYRSSYRATLYHPLDGSFAHQLSLMAQFSLIALGAPIARSISEGVCEVLGVVAIALLVMHVRPWLLSLGEDCYDWALLALALMAIIGAMEVAYGRSFEGLGAALGGRFTTPMSLLWISLILMAARTDAKRLRFFAAGVIPLAVLWCGSQLAGYYEFRDRSLALFAAAQVIPRWNTANEDEFPPLWPAETVLVYLHDAGDGPFLIP